MKPLSKKSRKIILIFLSVIFIIVAPILFLVSSGYRIDFKDFNFVKTGGIFIYSDLIGTKVFLDGEFVKNNGIFLRNTLIQNLKSEDIYKMRVEKEGYYTWYKDLIVYPNLVTEARVILIPKDINFEKINEFLVDSNSSSISKATTSLDKKLLNPEYSNISELFLGEINTEELIFPVEKEEKEEDVSTTTLSLEDNLLPDYILELNIEDIENKKLLKESGRILTWLENGDINVMWAGKEGSTPFYFCDIRGCRDRILVSLDTDISYYDFFPGRNDVLIVSTENHVFAVEIDDRSKQNIQKIYEGESPEFRIVRNTIFIKDAGDLYQAEI
jgi:hypothetical protein